MSSRAPARVAEIHRQIDRLLAELVELVVEREAPAELKLQPEPPTPLERARARKVLKQKGYKATR